MSANWPLCSHIDDDDVTIYHLVVFYFSLASLIFAPSCSIFFIQPGKLLTEVCNFVVYRIELLTILFNLAVYRTEPLTLLSFDIVDPILTLVIWFCCCRTSSICWLIFSLNELFCAFCTPIWSLIKLTIVLKLSLKGSRSVATLSIPPIPPSRRCLSPSQKFNGWIILRIGVRDVWRVLQCLFLLTIPLNLHPSEILLLHDATGK